MAEGKKRYFKLGPQASSFHDPKSGLNIAGNEVAEVDARAAKSSKAVRNAKVNGHIVEVEASDFKSAKLKAPDVNANVEKGGVPESSDAKLNKKDAPNAFKSESTSPNGLPSTTGGQGANASTVLDDEDDEDLEDEDDEDLEDEDDEDEDEDEKPAPKKAAPKKATEKKAKKGSKK